MKFNYHEANEAALECGRYEDVVAEGEYGSDWGSIWDEGSYEPLVEMEAGLSPGKAATEKEKALISQGL